MTELPHVSRDVEVLYERLSPFELKTKLSELADLHDSKLMLKAGRGNPNWIATTPRDAFFLLGQFGLTESRRVWEEPGIGGMPEAAGIADRLDAFLAARAGEPGVDLLLEAVAYGVLRKGFDADEWVHELTDAIIGDNYPVPDRMLRCTEQVVHDYLMAELCGQREVTGTFDLFAVEGGTAAMCYIFETLTTNRLLNPGDRIAIGLPVFTPYIEIPQLPQYQFEVVPLHASELDDVGFHSWQYPDDEIDKLADPTIKAVFLVNPSNPPSVMMRPGTLERMADVIRTANPDLIVITDDVYCSFVPGFESLLSIVPENVIGVYSFSKYFGCTGWRLGVIALHQDNVIDRMLAELPEDTRKALDHRYDTITIEPGKLRFIDRVVADSRHVALNHTAGLSLPQQVQMALFALAELTDTEDSYRTRLREILAERLRLLTAGTGVDLPVDPLRAGYYVELDLQAWAKRTYGPGFASFVVGNYEPVDFVFRLAEQESVVLLNGGGFDAPEWSIRVSLANLPDEAYERIGAAIARIGFEYVAEFVEAGGVIDDDPFPERRLGRDA
jgi:aspartate 4-decarboxylase